MSSHEPGLAPNGKPYESVWDFPRPPRLERVPWRIVVAHRGRTVVDAPEAVRVLETSQAPAYYIDPGHVDESLLVPSGTSSWCEWKGRADYVDLVVDGVRVPDAAWRYDAPTEPFRPLTGYYSFYAQQLDRCAIDDELVAPNEGSFYGGWITANVTGPFKGGPGTRHW